MKSITTTSLIVLIILSAINFSSSAAEYDWVSTTLDNDLFVGTDNGYTNGIYVSLFETGQKAGVKPDNDWLVNPLIWSMPEVKGRSVINSYMFGQTMITPSDINIVDPDQNEIPYSALLAVNNSYVTYDSSVADLVSTTVGIVGPLALGEETQSLIHRIIGSDDPQGWDTQLENELVFQFSRARLWRTWVSENKKFDLLVKAETNLGTISSDINAGATFRYGKGLDDSYVTSIYSSSRVINPSAINRGWYVFSRISSGYTFNQIYTDGNTFRNSRSIDYEKEFVELSLGFTYSWEKYSISFSVTDANILQSGVEKETLQNLTQYGSLTFAWKL